MPKLIAFDIDGTLLNSWPIFEKALLEYSVEANLQNPCLDSLRTGYAFPREIDYGWGLELHEQRDHLHNVFKRVDEHRSGVVAPMYEGAIKLLKELKKRDYTLGIVTSKPSEPLAAMLAHHDIEPIFCGIRTSCDVKLRGEKEKPAPDQLLSLAKELEFDPANTVMIGDTTMDIEMGRNAGAHTIGVTWGNHCVNRLTDAGAHKVIDNNFDELLDHITDITER